MEIESQEISYVASEAIGHSPDIGKLSGSSESCNS